MAGVSALVLTGCATGRSATGDTGPRGPEDERAVSILKQLFTLQMVYQAQNGRFATSIDELRSAGWEDQDTGRFRPAITDPGSRLCVAMIPTRGSRVAWSMSGRGALFRGPRCGR
jgi:hypothetical protein